MVYPDGAEHHSWWADTPQEEQAALTALAGLLGRLPGLPVVTWAGNSADLPRLVSAARRHDLYGLADALIARHLDAYLWLQRNARLPLLSLGLKDVAGYFGYRASTTITDGLDALMRYQAWLATKDEPIRAELNAYNRDDISALVHVIDRLTKLATAAAA